MKGVQLWAVAAALDPHRTSQYRSKDDEML